jgi:hypothetical protein
MNCEIQLLELDTGVGSRQARTGRLRDTGVREPFPSMTDVQQLEHVGFSREQIAGLLSLKALYQRGAYYEANPEHKRQAFVRWLYLQGRLES